MYEYFIGTLILTSIWSILFAFRKDLRKKMLLVSFLTMLLGPAEVLYVPEYWSPSTLFNLGRITGGFAIESLIFMFTIGGIGSVIYEVVFKVKIHRSNTLHILEKRHIRLHLFAILLGPISFIFLLIFTPINPIYSASIGMFIGGLLTFYCRPEFFKSVWFGGLTFLLLYFTSFLIFNLIFPGYVERTYTLNNLSGILIFDVPFEELLFAFTFGMFWSSIYEHIAFYTLKKI